MTPNTVFSIIAERYAGEFRTNGYVHIRNAIAPEFLEYARAQASAPSTQSPEVPGWQIAGKKRQCLFTFPNELSIESALDTLATLSSLDRRGLTISERHLKFYESNAPAFPAPHKDRLASHIAVGIPLEVPPESRLVLFPTHGRATNPLATAITWQHGLDEDAPAGLTLDSRSVVLDTRPGDLIILLGSSIYHERLHAAGTVILYLKLNATGLDPLGEHPRQLTDSATGSP